MSVAYNLDDDGMKAAKRAIRTAQKGAAPELRKVVQLLLKDAKKTMADATPRSSDADRDPNQPSLPHAADTYRYRTGGDGSGLLYNDAPYVGLLLSGTKPHMVAPLNGKALRWFSGGVAAFSKGHEVKGIKANPRMRAALADVGHLADLRMRQAGVEMAVRLDEDLIKKPL